MARPIRVEFPGALYHVTCRMIGEWRTDKAYLFRDDRDRERFLKQLGERVEQYHVRLYLFVCMANHFHLVFETPQANCARFMHALSTAYTVYFNLRHGRHGHLLDGRYKSKLVEGDEYLLALSRYVHLNPVQVGALPKEPLAARIATLRNDPWSSYPGYIGARPQWPFVDGDCVLAQIGGSARNWSRRYRAFVETGLANSDDEFMQALHASPRSIGSDEFRARIDELHHLRIGTGVRLEDAAFRHRSEPLAPGVVLEVLCEIFDTDTAAFMRRSHSSALRGVAARFLTRYAGLTQREVGELLHIGSGSAVCKQLQRLNAREPAQRTLRGLIQAAEKRLDALHARRKAPRG